MNNEKVFPKVGDQVYLRQFTGNYMVDMVKRPYTVVIVQDSYVVVQSAKLIAPVWQGPSEPEYIGQRVFFYNTVAESIEEDPTGRLEKLTWHPKRGLWGTPGSDKDYPVYMITGQGYQHQPYLD